MKRLKATTLLLISLATSTLTFGQWTDISPSGGHADDIIYDLHFSDESNGIAVGTNPGTYEGLLYVTSDGGKTWSRKNYSNTAWRSIHFTDPQNGFIAGRVSDQSGSMTTQILRTTDGGKTWSQKTGKDNGITAVSFVNDKVGYSIGGGANIGEAGVQKTTDGGKTWSSTWSTYGWFISSIYFTDENTGFIAGSKFTGGYSSVIAKTTDGGKTFNEVNYQTEASASGLYFIDENTGYVLDRTMQSSRKLSKTTDKGSTWNKIADMDKDVHLLYFNGSDDAFAAGGNGEVYKSTDGGSNWTPMASTGYNKTIRNIKFFGDNMYIMGQNPFIKKAAHNGDRIGFTSIDQLDASNASSLKLYPNPVSNSGVINLDTDSQLDGEFILINSIGKVVLSTTTAGNQVDLGGSALKAGVYFYQFRTDEERSSGKLVIK